MTMQNIKEIVKEKYSQAADEPNEEMELWYQSAGESASVSEV